MRQTALCLVLVVAACSTDSTAATTSTSTTIETTTTATEVTTTSSTSTTTTAMTSTTTTAAVATTTGGLEGNWAQAPLITTEFGALGWWDGSHWVDAETEGALPVAGGEDYQATRLGAVTRTTAGPQTLVCSPLDLVGVELADEGLLGAYPGPYGVAISAPWVLQPHLFEEIDDDGSYAGHAAELLAERGLDVEEPVIKQVIRTDLEGDGVTEVLVVAEEVTPGLILEVGDYSIAFMHKVVDGEVQTAVLADTVVLDPAERFGGAHTIGGVADLNGDGKMEIISNSAYFEAMDVTIWEYIDDDIGPFPVLQIGCGS